MEKTITYLGIEKAEYKFSEYDILTALQEKYKIKSGYGHNYTFDLIEGYEDEEPYAELVVKYPRVVNRDEGSTVQ